jgi:hypothetical protein
LDNSVSKNSTICSETGARGFVVVADVVPAVGCRCSCRTVVLWCATAAAVVTVALVVALALLAVIAAAAAAELPPVPNVLLLDDGTIAVADILLRFVRGDVTIF